jgi:hypothetical protein
MIAKIEFIVKIFSHCENIGTPCDPLRTQKKKLA